MERRMLKLGIIGLSPGNGHPYSWSAIFNGYNAKAMAGCPFPAIPDYLSKQKYPNDFLNSAKVTHIWTQDETISAAVASASKIGTICRAPQDMIGRVDGILMARDDWQNHEQNSRIFIESGLPIYIDKPLANTRAGAETILSLEKNTAQIFSASAFRYAEELRILPANADKITAIKAHVIKSWSLYSIHIIEPLVTLLYPICGEGKIEIMERQHHENGAVFLKARWGDIDIELSSTGNGEGGIGLNIAYENGKTANLAFKNTFYAFKTTLQMFINQMVSKEIMIPRQQTLKCMEWIEHGNG